METYSYQRILPSCTLNRTLLVEIEKRLLFDSPKILFISSGCLVCLARYIFDIFRSPGV